MREIRMFEMEEHEPATVWRASRPLVINVTSGQLWVIVRTTGSKRGSRSRWRQACVPGSDPVAERSA